MYEQKMWKVRIKNIMNEKEDGHSKKREEGRT